MCTRMQLPTANVLLNCNLHVTQELCRLPICSRGNNRSYDLHTVLYTMPMDWLTIWMDLWGQWQHIRTWLWLTEMTKELRINLLLQIHSGQPQLLSYILAGWLLHITFLIPTCSLHNISSCFSTYSDAWTKVPESTQGIPGMSGRVGSQFKEGKVQCAISNGWGSWHY